MSCKQESSGIMEQPFIISKWTWLLSAWQWKESPCFLRMEPRGRRYKEYLPKQWSSLRIGSGHALTHSPVSQIRWKPVECSTPNPNQTFQPGQQKTVHSVKCCRQVQQKKDNIVPNVYCPKHIVKKNHQGLEPLLNWTGTSPVQSTQLVLNASGPTQGGGHQQEAEATNKSEKWQARLLGQREMDGWLDGWMKRTTSAS